MTEMPDWLYNLRWGVLEDLLWHLTGVRNGFYVKGYDIVDGIEPKHWTTDLRCKVRRYRGRDPQYIAFEQVGNRYATGDTEREAIRNLAEIVADYIACLVEHEHAMSQMMHKHLAGYEQYATIDRARVLASLAEQKQVGMGGINVHPSGEMMRRGVRE